MIQRAERTQETDKSGRIAGLELPFADYEKIATAFANVFRGPAADLVLKALRSATLDLVGGPLISNDQLRHMEGQRFIVQQIDALIKAGHDINHKRTTAKGKKNG